MMTDTLTSEQVLHHIIVVLHRPQDAQNVGAVVRAMKNMGMHDLRLVQPAPLARATLLRVAHHCEDLVDGMRSYANLKAALADTRYVIGTAATQHKARPQTQAIRQVALDITAQAQQGKVALLFGQEDDGLDQAALDCCHRLVTLPAAADYPALNLAQSVLLLLYEVRMTVLGTVLDTVLGNEHAHPHLPPVATQATLEQLFQVSERALATLGFFKGNPAAVMRKIRQIVYKASLTPDEAALLLAIARRITQRITQRDAPMEPPAPN